MKQLFCSFSVLFILASCSMWQSVISDEDDTISINTTPVQEKIILALWDSLTAGFWLQMSESYPSKLENILDTNNYNYRVINAGVSWDTSKNLLDRAELYLDQNSDIVLLVIWWNDGLRAQSTETLQQNIQSIIDMYEWEAEIVLWGMEIPTTLWLNYSRDFKQVYFDLAQENPEVYFHESFLEDVGWVARLNQADRIHPTSEWYDIIVQNLYEFLKDENIIQK